MTGYDGVGLAPRGGLALVQGTFVQRVFLAVTGYFGTLIFCGPFRGIQEGSPGEGMYAETNAG